MPRLKEIDLEKTARNYKANTGVGCDGFHPTVPLGLETNKRRGGGIPGEGGTVWEMAATSLHNDVLFNPKKCNERASHCTNACDDSLVGSPASAGPLMDAMEELNALYGRPCWRWKDSMTMHDKEIREP